MPFSQACENNKLPILQILRQHLEKHARVLEIAGGTGQHAVYFAESMPAIHWQSTDIAENVATLNIRIEHAALPNLPAAIALDVNADWPDEQYDAIFSANCLHIIAEQAVEHFFSGVGPRLNENGLLLVYGPFKYGGEFTTESNARFDAWLKARDPASGIRDFEWINGLADHAGLDFVEDNAMPANNQLLIWRSRNNGLSN